MDSLALVVAILAAIGAVGAWLAAHRSNGLSRRANEIATQAAALAEQQADRAIDSVGWRLEPHDDGRTFSVWNTSAEHTAHNAQAFAMIVGQTDGKQTLTPVLSRLASVPPRLRIELALSADTLSAAGATRTPSQVPVLMGVTWQTAGGIDRRYLFDVGLLTLAS